MHVFVCWEPGTKCSPRNFSFGIVPVWLFIWLQLKKFGSVPVWFYSLNVLFGLCFSSLLSSNDECDWIDCWFPSVLAPLFTHILHTNFFSEQSSHKNFCDRYKNELEKKDKEKLVRLLDHQKHYLVVTLALSFVNMHGHQSTVYRILWVNWYVMIPEIGYSRNSKGTSGQLQQGWKR